MSKAHFPSSFFIMKKLKNSKLVQKSGHIVEKSGGIVVVEKSFSKPKGGKRYDDIAKQCIGRTKGRKRK